MTGWAAFMLTLHSEHQVLEYFAVGGVVVLMVSLFSAGVQLWRMTRDSPNQRDLLQQILATTRQQQANDRRAPDEA